MLVGNDADPAAVEAHDPVGERQADAVPAHVPAITAPVEGLEHQRQLLRRNGRPQVVKHQGERLPLLPEPHAHCVVGRELAAVFEQVEQGDVQQV